MAHRYDVSLKALFMSEGDGIIRRRLFGGKVAKHLPTEQPQVSNRRADMVVQTEDGSLHQVEFVTSNEAGFPLRMLEYYTYLVRVHNRHICDLNHKVAAGAALCFPALNPEGASWSDPS